MGTPSRLRRCLPGVSSTPFEAASAGFHGKISFVFFPPRSVFWFVQNFFLLRTRAGGCRLFPPSCDKRRFCCFLLFFFPLRASFWTILVPPSPPSPFSFVQLLGERLAQDPPLLKYQRARVSVPPSRGFFLPRLTEKLFPKGFVGSHPLPPLPLGLLCRIALFSYLLLPRRPVLISPSPQPPYLLQVIFSSPSRHWRGGFPL